MKSLFLGIFVALFFTIVNNPFIYGQDNSDTVFYKKIYDDPTYSYVGIGPSFDLSINDHNFTLAAFGLAGTYYSFDQKLLGTVRSRFHLGEEITNYNNKGFPSNRSVYEVEKSRDMTLEGVYFIKQSVKSVESFIELDKKSGISYVSEVEALEATQYGVGAGVRFMTTYYNFGSSNSLEGIRQFDEERVTLDDKTATYLTQKVLRLSFSRLKVQEFEITTDKFGNRTGSDFSRVYGGLHLGVSHQYDDVLEIMQFQNGTELQEIGLRYNINETVDYFPVGFFAGWEALSGINTGFGGALGSKVEIGLLPGPKDFIASNFYFDLSIHYEFGYGFNN